MWGVCSLVSPIRVCWRESERERSRLCEGLSLEGKKSFYFVVVAGKQSLVACFCDAGTYKDLIFWKKALELNFTPFKLWISFFFWSTFLFFPLRSAFLSYFVFNFFCHQLVFGLLVLTVDPSLSLSWSKLPVSCKQPFLRPWIPLTWWTQSPVARPKQIPLASWASSLSLAGFRTPPRFTAMLRCVLQRANNLRHSHPLASVTFRGKRIMGDSGDRQQDDRLNRQIDIDTFEVTILTYNRYIESVFWGKSSLFSSQVSGPWGKSHVHKQIGSQAVGCLKLSHAFVLGQCIICYFFCAFSNECPTTGAINAPAQAPPAVVLATKLLG